MKRTAGMAAGAEPVLREPDDEERSVDLHHFVLPDDSADISKDPAEAECPDADLEGHRDQECHDHRLPGGGADLGLAEMHIENVTLENLKISAKKGMRIANADGIKFVNSSIKAESGPATMEENATVSGLK